MGGSGCHFSYNDSMGGGWVIRSGVIAKRTLICAGTSHEVTISLDRGTPHILSQGIMHKRKMSMKVGTSCLVAFLIGETTCEVPRVVGPT
jgi:hypothetical protein